MSRFDIAVLLALAAAVCIAIGDANQQRAAQHLADPDSDRVTVLLGLLRDRGWWLGSVVAIAGFALQAAALGFGSVVLVQALLVTSLLFALPFGAWLAHRRVPAREWAWAAVLAAAVAVVVVVGNPTEGAARASFEAWLPAVVVLGPLFAVGLLAVAATRGSARAALLGVLAGGLWGVFALLTKGVVAAGMDGPGALLRCGELYALIAVSLAGLALQQLSFHAGPLTAALPGAAVAEPVVGAALGIVVLGESVHPGRSGGVLLGAAVAMMVVAALALARHEGTPAAD